MPHVDLEVIRLQPGRHPGSPDGCLMEWVSVIGRVIKTDRPGFVNELVTSVAIHLNDSLDDVSRQRLKAFIPRLLEARRSPADQRIGVRLAIWAAASIAGSAPDGLRDLQEEAVRAAAGRLAGSVTDEACRAAAIAAAEAGAKRRNTALYVAADAAHAACADDPSSGTVNAVAGALHWVLRHGDPLDWFAGFLAAHAESRAEENIEEMVCSPA
jgi:hypothetical protein